MIAELVGLFANFVRAAFLPESLENLSDMEREKFGLWPTVSKSLVAGTWLPHCVRTIRWVFFSVLNAGRPLCMHVCVHSYRHTPHSSSL